MADNGTTLESENGGQQQLEGDGGDFKPITSQEELNRALASRLERERAKYADYKDVKAKAARLDDIEEANKSEAQRLSDRATAAERERDEARVEGLRFKIAAKHGISEEDAELFLTGTDEEALTRQAKRLAGRAAEREEEAQAAETQRRKNGNVVPKEGKATRDTDTEALSILGFGL